MKVHVAVEVGDTEHHNHITQANQDEPSSDSTRLRNGRNALAAKSFYINKGVVARQLVP